MPSSNQAPRQELSKLPKPTMPTRRCCCDCIWRWALASKSKGMAASRARMRRPVSSDDLFQSAVVKDRTMSNNRKAAHLHISYAKTAAACNAFLLMIGVNIASGSVGWCGDCMSEVAH